jgi:hypothetical protein
MIRRLLIAMMMCVTVFAATSCATKEGDGRVTEYRPPPSLSSSAPSSPPTLSVPQTYEPFPGCDAAFCTQLSINGVQVIDGGPCPAELERERVTDLECRGGVWRAIPPG